MPKFPFTNYHELNLDWILKKVDALFDASEENAATIRTYNARLTSAEQTATSAETAATAAQQLADAAAENANSALSVAGTANAKADSAMTAATNAAGAASGAMTAAQAAQQTAGAAVATANDAAATASSLESLANTANQNATAALETAQTADQKAVAAQTAAQTADQKAVAAQTAAQTADQKAAAAQSAATTNAGNISTLQTTVTDLNRQISDEIAELKTTTYGNVVDISAGTPQTGKYYSATAGNTISLSNGDGYYYPAIDLSAYKGQTVKVSFTTSASSSTRCTALCDADGVVDVRFYEREIYATGYCEFIISDRYNQLYISYSLSGNNLQVEVIDNSGLVTVVKEIQRQMCYVSAASGSDNNNGDFYHPFRTLQKAIDSGAAVIRAYSGNYTGFSLNHRITPLTVELATMPLVVTTPDVPKIKITTASGSNGIDIRNCSEVYLSDIWVDGTSGNSFFFQNIDNLECVRCYASNNSGTDTNGFLVYSCNCVFRGCKAWDVVHDGFSLHFYGNSYLLDCVAYNCGDDGVSHHDGCTGSINGGEYYNCTKGGVSSPTYGVSINITNVYSHDNNYGLYATSNSSKPCYAQIANCVFRDNTTYDMLMTDGTYIGYGLIYTTKQVASTATFTEIT